MFCVLCKKFNKRPFNNEIWTFKPCNRLTLQSTVKHEHNAAHMDSVKLEAPVLSSENVGCALNRLVPEKGMETSLLMLLLLDKTKDSTFSKLHVNSTAGLV